MMLRRFKTTMILENISITNDWSAFCVGKENTRWLLT